MLFEARDEVDTVGTMITRIFHPNVSKAGEICVDTLKKGWDKKFGIGHVLVVCPFLSFHIPSSFWALSEGRKQMDALQRRIVEGKNDTDELVDDQMSFDLP